ncbi:hypothetical protein KOW79_001049 [Hemibagrus wyckioides]|uniref:Uncharacterized protein n=1 Tax=Hemibagrus wyckioides TaxID=337641 RepID=A0A9D3P860_9TELE|nr:hypothetical protein KOW79_001049 [Hemibagrus wyckioides]
MKRPRHALHWNRVVILTKPSRRSCEKNGQRNILAVGRVFAVLLRWVSLHNYADMQQSRGDGGKKRILFLQRDILKSLLQEITFKVAPYVSELASSGVEITRAANRKQIRTQDASLTDRRRLEKRWTHMTPVPQALDTLEGTVSTTLNLRQNQHTSCTSYFQS